MIKLLFATLLLLSTIINASAPEISRNIVALQAEIGESISINLTDFFNDNDDIHDSPTTMSFSLSGNNSWVSISGLNLNISATPGLEGSRVSVTITANDTTGGSVSQSVEILVPSQRSSNNNFPLIGVPYLDAGAYILHENIMDPLEPVISDRVPFIASIAKDCSIFIDELPSTSIISSSIIVNSDDSDDYNGSLSIDSVYQYAFPKSGSSAGTPTIPWERISKKSSFSTLYDSPDATDEYKKLIQQNQVCEIEKNQEFATRYTAASNYGVDSPYQLEIDVTNEMNQRLVDLGSQLNALVDDIDSDGYGNSSHTVLSVEQRKNTYDKEFKFFNELLCDIYNENSEIEEKMFMGSSPGDILILDGSLIYKEDPVFFDEKMDQVRGIVATKNHQEGGEWRLVCADVSPSPQRATPQGQGVESAKVLYSLGYRNIPQTKEDGLYDKGLVNQEKQNGNMSTQKKTHFASVKKGANAYMSTGIQNGPSKFHYEVDPGDLDERVNQLVKSDIDAHKAYNIFVGNKSSNSSLRGMLIQGTRSDDPSRVQQIADYVGINKVVHRNKYLIPNNATVEETQQQFQPVNNVINHDAVLGWDTKAKTLGFLNNNFTEWAPTILELYNQGFNTDNTACTTNSDTECEFSFSLYLTDGGDSGIRFLPESFTRDSQIFGGSSLSVSNKSNINTSKEFLNNLTDVEDENGYLDKNGGTSGSLTMFGRKTVNISEEVTVSEPDGNGGYTDVTTTTTRSEIHDPEYKANMYYTLTYEEMSTEVFNYDLNGFAMIMPPGYFTGSDNQSISSTVPAGNGYILSPNKNQFDPSSKSIFNDLKNIIDRDNVINPAYISPLVAAGSVVGSSSWGEQYSAELGNFLNQNTAVGSAETILSLYGSGYNWDGGKCIQPGDSSCIFAFSLYLGNGGMYLKPIAEVVAAGSLAGTRTLGSPLTRDNQIKGMVIEKVAQNSGGQYHEVNSYLDVDGDDSTLQYLNDEVYKADLYYSLTYDQMSSGSFGYELSGLGILLPPGYFYSGEQKQLNSYNFLQAKSSRYSNVDAGYQAYVFTDENSSPTTNNLLKDNGIGKKLISMPRITPTDEYCKSISQGLSLESGYCVGDPCTDTQNYIFNSSVGVCEKRNTDVDDKDDMCANPPEFKPIGATEIGSSARIDQTVLDGGNCKTTIPVKVLPTSCKEIKDIDQSSISGEYTIFLADQKTKVYCEMEIEDGGWTLAIRDPDGLEPIPCAYCHGPNVWPGSDLVNPDNPTGSEIHVKTTGRNSSKPDHLTTRSAYKGLPFFTMKPTSILYKSYNIPHGRSSDPNYEPSGNISLKDTKILRGIWKDSSNNEHAYRTLSNAAATTIGGSKGKVKTQSPLFLSQSPPFKSASISHHYYLEELYVKGSSLPIKIKRAESTMNSLNIFTRAEPLSIIDMDGYLEDDAHKRDIPKPLYPYVSTVLEMGEIDRVGEKHALYIETMDRMKTISNEDPATHTGNVTDVSLIIEKEGVYNYKYSLIHQNEAPNQNCDNKPYIEITTASHQELIELCAKDFSSATVDTNGIKTSPIRWIDGSFETTTPGEVVDIKVSAQAEYHGDWAGMMFFIPYNNNVDFTEISSSSVTSVNLCGPGYSLTADMSACQHTSYKQCSDNSQLITSGSTTICASLPDNCSVSELENINSEIEVAGSIIAKKEYGQCKFPAFPETSIDLLKNISSRIFYNKFIKENNGLIIPADLNGLEISSDYFDDLKNFENDLDAGTSLWDMDEDGAYPNLNKALRLSSDYVNAADLKKITDSYNIDSGSKKKFLKATGILKENLPYFSIDTMAISYDVMARKIRDLPQVDGFGPSLVCMDGEGVAYADELEKICMGTQKSIDDIYKYKWNPIEQGQDAKFKFEVNGNKAKLTVKSFKSIVMDFGLNIKISDQNIHNLLLQEIQDETGNSKNDSLIKTVINCTNYKINIDTKAIASVSNNNTNGEGSIYGTINCEEVDSSYSNVSISNFTNVAEAGKSDLLESLEVRSILGLAEANPQINSCISDISQIACGTNTSTTNPPGSYQFTTWVDGISKQKYEERENFKENINIYIPKKLTTSYIKERETNIAAVDQIKEIIGTVSHDENANLVMDESTGQVVFSDHSGIFTGKLTTSGSTYLAELINNKIQSSFPYRSTEIPIIVSTDMFEDSMALNQQSISEMLDFTLAKDKVSPSSNITPLSTIFLPADGYVGIKNNIVNGGSLVAEYKSEVSDDGSSSEVSIGVPGFKKAIDSTAISRSGLLSRFDEVFPLECSHLSISGYQNNLSLTDQGVYDYSDKYVSRSQSSPEYELISNFIISTDEQKNIVEYAQEAGKNLVANSIIEHDTEIEIEFSYKTTYEKELTKYAELWSVDPKYYAGRLISDDFEVIKVDSPTEQYLRCKKDIYQDSSNKILICQSGGEIPNSEVSNYYYSSTYLSLLGGIELSINNNINKVKSQDIVTVKKGNSFTAMVMNPYLDMSDFIVRGTESVLLNTSDNPSSIGSPRYKSIYYKNSLDKYGDIEDLYFSRFSGGELTVDMDINEYNALDSAVRDRCDMVYGKPVITSTPSVPVTTPPSVSTVYMPSVAVAIFDSSSLSILNSEPEIYSGFVEVGSERAMSTRISSEIERSNSNSNFYKWLITRIDYNGNSRKRADVNNDDEVNMDDYNLITSYSNSQLGRNNALEKEYIQNVIFSLSAYDYYRDKVFFTETDFLKYIGVYVQLIQVGLVNSISNHSIYHWMNEIIDNNGMQQIRIDINNDKSIGVSDTTDLYRYIANLASAAEASYINKFILSDRYVDPDLNGNPLASVVVIDYQRADIKESVVLSNGNASDDSIISSSNDILNQLKCTKRATAAAGGAIHCNDSFENSIKFNNFEIRNIFNNNVILTGQAKADFLNDSGVKVSTDIDTSIVSLKRNDELSSFYFDVRTSVDLRTIADIYSLTADQLDYVVPSNGILGLIDSVLSYNPDYRLYVGANGFYKSRTSIPINFNMVLNTEVTNISTEIESSINIARNACLSVSNFDESVIEEMKEKNKFYMAIKTGLEVSAVLDELNIDWLSDLRSDSLKQDSRVQKLEIKPFKVYWNGPSMGAIRDNYRASQTAETALRRYILGYNKNENGISTRVAGVCETSTDKFLHNIMEPAKSEAESTGLFCKLAHDFMFNPSNDNYVFEPTGTTDIGISVQIPAYNTNSFDFGDTVGFGTNTSLSGMINDEGIYRQEEGFWRRVHHYVLNSKNNLYSQVMKGVALHEFEYKKQMSGIVNIDFLDSCTASLSDDGVYSAMADDLSLKRTFSSPDGIKSLMPSVLILDSLSDYNSYSPVSSLVGIQTINSGVNASFSAGSGHIENNNVSLTKVSGLSCPDAANFCKNIIKPTIISGNKYLDSSNIQIIAGAQTNGDGVINVTVSRALSNQAGNNKYRDYLSNPNWLQDKVCVDGYRDIGIRISKRKINDPLNLSKCDGGIASGACSQGGPPSFGWLDYIRGIFGSNHMKREMNIYNDDGIMKLVKICGVSNDSAAGLDFAGPGDDTSKKKIRVFDESENPKDILEGNILLPKHGVDKAKLNMQALYSDSGCSDSDTQCRKVVRNGRSLIINSINLFNTITNKKSGQDRTLGLNDLVSSSSLSLDTGSPIQNIVNSCMKFKGKVSYRKIASRTDSDLILDASLGSNGICSASPKRYIDKASCYSAGHRWENKVPLIKSYSNADKDYSFVDPRNGQQRSVRGCSDIFIENEDVFNEEFDGPGNNNERKRDEMVRQFVNNIAGCSGSTFANDKDAREEVEKLRDTKMNDLVEGCGIKLDIAENPNAYELLTNELSSFEDVSAGTYDSQSEDGLFHTQVGRDKEKSFGALKDERWKDGDFSETPTIDSSAVGMMKKNEEKMNSGSNAGGFAAGLLALGGILETMDSIPGINVNTNMVKAVNTAIVAVSAVSLVNMVKNLKDIKDGINSGSAAVKAANEINQGNRYNDAIGGANLGFVDGNKTVGEYVDEIIDFDKKMAVYNLEQSQDAIDNDEYKRMMKDYEEKRSGAEAKLQKAGIYQKIEDKKQSYSTDAGLSAYDIQIPKDVILIDSVTGQKDYSKQKEREESNFYTPSETSSYYDNLKNNSAGDFQAGHYDYMDGADAIAYKEKLMPGVDANLNKDEGILGYGSGKSIKDQNIIKIYEKLENYKKDSEGSEDYFKNEMQKYQNYQLDQQGITIEGL